jgi:hypothetical protein
MSSIIRTAGFAGGAVTFVVCLPAQLIPLLVQRLGDAARPQQNRTASKQIIFGFMTVSFYT